MKNKSDVEVIIDGKRYNMCGYESEEYLQRVASYINSKIAELKGMNGYNHLDVDMKNVLIQINLCDDYFKLKDQAKELGGEKESMEGEIFNLKQDIIEAQKELNNLKESYKAKVAEANQLIAVERNKTVDEQKKCVRLETEAEAMKKEIETLKAELDGYKKRYGKR